MSGPPRRQAIERYSRGREVKENRPIPARPWLDSHKRCIPPLPLAHREFSPLGLGCRLSWGRQSHPSGPSAAQPGQLAPHGP